MIVPTIQNPSSLGAIAAAVAAVAATPLEVTSHPIGLHLAQRLVTLSLLIRALCLLAVDVQVLPYQWAQLGLNLRVTLDYPPSQDPTLAEAAGLAVHINRRDLGMVFSVGRFRLDLSCARVEKHSVWIYVASDVYVRY